MANFTMPAERPGQLTKARNKTELAQRKGRSSWRYFMKLYQLCELEICWFVAGETRYWKKSGSPHFKVGRQIPRRLPGENGQKNSRRVSPPGGLFTYLICFFAFESCAAIRRRPSETTITIVRFTMDGVLRGLVLCRAGARLRRISAAVYRRKYLN